MTPRPILTAAAMRAAEGRTIDAGTSVATLMARAGAAVAEAAWRFAAGAPTLVLCGPGNNGGDGLIAATTLRARGVPVRVAMLDEVRGVEARAARAGWGGGVEPFERTEPAPVLIDGLFGTGLTRGLDPAVGVRMRALAAGARHRIAIDLPSGIGSDDGGTFAVDLPSWDLTVALGALKPAHRLQPAAALCGRIVVADIGLGPIRSDLVEIGRPSLPAPAPHDHKYSRGMVAVLGGGMAGASLLAATAAQRCGAGYVLLVGGGDANGLHALVHRAELSAIQDERVDAVLCGPGLGRGEPAERRVAAALASGRPLVLDAEALPLVTMEQLGTLPHRAILTPHEGEFGKMFGTIAGSKLDRARMAAARANAVVVLKGADTVVAAPDGRAAITVPSSPWLATAGTGDVLAGAIAAMRARIGDPFAAAQAGVWLHGRAAELAGPVLVADDLFEELRKAVAACR